MRLVNIDGLVFTGEPAPGDRFVYTDLKGWFGAPPMRADVEDRPNSDGAFGSLRNYRSARVLQFEGALVGADPLSAQEELMDAFAAVQADGRPFPLSVTTEAGMRSVTATLQGEASVVPDWSMQRARVDATFICYDPVKYGPESTVTTGLPTPGGGLEYPLGDPGGALYYGALGTLGRVTLTNEGTADTWPVFEVSGTLVDGFQLRRIDTGDVLQYDRVVPAGTTVTIDCRTGAVLIDGVSDGSTYLTRDDFFSVPARGSCEVQFSAVSTGTDAMLTARFRSGWW